MADFVVQLSDKLARNPAITGGKGSALAKLVKAKVPVPDGFVVTAAAFEHGLEAIGPPVQMHPPRCSVAYRMHGMRALLVVDFPRNKLRSADATEVPFMVLALGHTDRQLVTVTPRGNFDLFASDAEGACCHQQASPLPPKRNRPNVSQGSPASGSVARASARPARPAP